MPPADATRFEKLIRLIAGSDAEVVLIGGLAAILFGSENDTVDVDFAFRRTRATTKAIAEALAPFHPRPLDFPEGVPFVWDEASIRNMATLTLVTDLGRIDFLNEPAGVDSVEGLIARSVEVDFEGVGVRVASIGDLIAMKKAAGRPKDLLHLAVLERLKKLMEEDDRNGE